MQFTIKLQEWYFLRNIASDIRCEPTVKARGVKENFHHIVYCVVLGVHVYIGERYWRFYGNTQPRSSGMKYPIASLKQPFLFGFSFPTELFDKKSESFGEKVRGSRATFS